MVRVQILKTKKGFIKERLLFFFNFLKFSKNFQFKKIMEISKIRENTWNSQIKKINYLSIFIE